ncbi:MAG: hypothetical protein S4CHLAM37_13820 [Chlamydiia bacterium]|nr:hypothetical protein [Chlamydiia bacterium]
MASIAISDKELRADRLARACDRRTGHHIDEYRPSYNPMRSFTYSEDTYRSTGRPKYVIDSVSNGRYYSIGGMKLRGEHLKLIFTTILIRLPYSIASSSVNLAKSPYHLLRKAEAGEEFPLKDRISTAALSIVKAISTLVHVILLEITAIYGLIKPVAGRNLYQDLQILSPKCGIQRIDRLELLSHHTRRVN